MIDGIIKADGTSRLMRAELPATYEEFRAQCLAGAQPLDILFNALGWSQMPTFLNKANLAKDTTAALYGKDSDAVPDDLFAWIGQYNEYWWSVLHGQASVLYEEKRTAQSLAGATNIHSMYDESTFEYADSIFVDQETGAVSLASPTTVVVPARNTNETLLRNFGVAVQGKYASGLSFDTDSIYFIPSGTVFLYPSDGSHYAMRLDDTTTFYKISSEAVNIPAGETTYVHSTDRNAYPDSGTVDGLTYQYLGIPFQNAVTAPKIATGSYTGTDAIPSTSSPMQLTFDFAPKIVMITGRYNPSGTMNHDNQYYLFPHFLNASDYLNVSFVDLSMLEPDVWTYGMGFGARNYSGNFYSVGKKSADGKTFMWARYGAQGGEAYNIAGNTYYYLAIG